MLSYHRRSGITLTEVLAAIFIVSIGLIALLAMFPMGAMQMAQAIKDEKCAQSAQHAEAYMRRFWLDSLTTEPSLAQATTNTLANRNNSIFSNPYAPYPNGTVVGVNASAFPPGYSATFRYPTSFQPLNYLINPTPPTFPTADGNNPSYPVIIDPIGWESQLNVSTQHRWWVGGQDVLNGGIPRRTLNSLRSIPGNSRSALRIRATSLLDTMNFNEDGVPDPTEIQYSEQIYNWAFMLRRPVLRTNGTVQLHAIVYQNRAPDVPTDETIYSASFIKGQPLVTVNYTGSRPPIRKGGWILDSSFPLYQHGHFYRVINITESTANQLELELQIPALETATNGRLLLMDRVAEVFDLGLLSNTSGSLTLPTDR
jgi:type II secretory pathway pseudopilin PulG